MSEPNFVPVRAALEIPNKDIIIVAVACAIVVPVSYKIAARLTEKFLNKVDPLDK